MLRAIVPHLVIAALGPPNDLDAVGWRLSEHRPGRFGRRRAPRRWASRALVIGGIDAIGRAIHRARHRSAQAATGRPARHRRLRIAPAGAAAVQAEAEVGEADRPRGRAVLIFTGLAQHQAQLTDLLAEREFLGVDRIDLERRGLGQDRLAVGALGVLIGGNDADVLQQNIGQLGVATRRLVGNQDIDGIIGLDEAGDPGHVVEANGGGAHAVG